MLTMRAIYLSMIIGALLGQLATPYPVQASLQAEYWRLQLDGVQVCPEGRRPESLTLYLHFWDEREASAWTEGGDSLGEEYPMALQGYWQSPRLYRFSVSGGWTGQGWVSLVGWAGMLRMGGRYLKGGPEGCQGWGTFRLIETWHVPE